MERITNRLTDNENNHKLQSYCIFSFVAYDAGLFTFYYETPAVSTFSSCTSFQVQNMAKSNASGVLVYALPGNPIQDMNCVGDECNSMLSIPASMVHQEPSVAQALQ